MRSPLPTTSGSCRRTARRNGSIAFAKGAKAEGFKVIIAGAGGAAHLPGMTASMTALRCSACRSNPKRCPASNLALFDRADASGRAGRHAGDRQVRRDQRRAARRQRAGGFPTPHWRRGWRRGASSRPTRWPIARRTKRDRTKRAARQRCHHRHPWRRAARRMLALAAARLGFNATCSVPIRIRRRSMWCGA